MLGPSLDTRRIRKAFSESADRYDHLSDLQKNIGQTLISKIPRREYRYILDVGMGTGGLTRDVGSLHPGAKVFGIDFADGMIQRAKRTKGSFTIIQADASALPFHANSFDLIVSNSAYQWVADLKKVFECSCSVLKEGGVLCASMFCYHSLQELFASFENSAAMPPGALPFRRLLSRERIYSDIRGAGFRKVGIESKTLNLPFDDMFQLLKWLKGIGANTPGHKIFLGKQAMGRAAEYYKKNFRMDDQIYASFEIAWIKAEK